MTTPPRLLLLPLLTALLLHWASLSWLAQNMPKTRPFANVAEPLFTRVLEAAEPARITQAAKPATPNKKKTKAGFDAATAPPAPSAPEEPGGDPAKPAPIAETPAPEPLAQAAPAPVEPERTAEPAGQPAGPADPLDRWPLDTRLSYRLGGFYRGELHGNARVLWQREKANYQVMLSLGATGLTLATLTSQGDATEAGLVPRVYEEKLPGGLRRADFSAGLVRFQDGQVALLPAGAQDTVSQFVELAQRFASGRDTLVAGAQVRIWLARPGGLDEWIYDVGEVETLQSPEMGPIQAYPLKPRPLAKPRGAISAEMWFAPSLQYLPVRVRITLGGGNFVDLLIERIEQTEVAKDLK